MWRLALDIVVTFFKNPEGFLLKFYKSAIGKFIQKYISADIIEMVSGGDLTNIISPDVWLRAFQKANARDVNALLKEIKGLNKGEREQAIKELNVTQSTPINLSSSWVKKGAFIQYANSTAGNLIIWTHSETAKNPKWYGPYIYPSVDKEIWLKMRAAKSKYGHRGNPIGAGSVMWTYFLDEWIPSALRSFIVNHPRTPYHITTIKYFDEQGRPRIRKAHLEERVKVINSAEKRFTNLKPTNKKYTPESEYHKLEMQWNKEAFQGQKSMIVSSSRARLTKDLAEAKNPLYELNEAMIKYKRKMNKLKRNLNVKKQVLRQGKQAVFGYADAMKGKNAK